MNHELVMPKDYVNLSEEEMEYDGGFLNILASAVGAAVGIATTVAGFGLSVAGTYLNNDALKTAGNVVSTVGVVLTVASTVLVAGVGAGVIVSVSKEAAAKVGAQIMCVDSWGVATTIAMW